MATIKPKKTKYVEVLKGPKMLNSEKGRGKGLAIPENIVHRICTRNSKNSTSKNQHPSEKMDT
jgi:hypothetical protein